MPITIKLDKEKESKLRQQQRNLHDLLPFVDKLEICGDNCDELRQTIHEQMSKIELMLKHFGSMTGG